MGSSGTRLDPTVVHAAALEAVEGLDLVVVDGDGKVPEQNIPDRLSESELTASIDQAVEPVSDAATAAQTDATKALATTYTTPRGAGVAFLGDSITAYDSNIGHAWHKVLSTLTGNKLRHRGFFATAGYTLAQIETTHLPQVLALSPKPGACVIAGGTNDTGAVGYDPATSHATWLRIVTALRAAGIMPVGWTLPPREDSTTVNGYVQKWNAWVRFQCQALGIPLVDAHAALVDPATGLYLAARKLDTVHPNLEGHYNIGKLAAADPAFVARFYDSSPHLSRDVLDAANLIPSGRGLFNQGVNGAQVPTGWSGYGQGTAYTPSQVAGASPVVGNWQVLTKADGGVGDNTTQGGLQYNITTGFAAGDRMALAVRMKVSAPDSGLIGAGSASLQARASGVTVLTGNPMGQVGGTWEGIAYGELVVPSGTDTVRVDLSVSAASAPTSDVAVSFAQATLLNLTALGLG